MEGMRGTGGGKSSEGGVSTEESAEGMEETDDWEVRLLRGVYGWTWKFGPY